MNGILYSEENEISIFPNPASSQITIKTPESLNWMWWSIYSIEGKEMLTGFLYGSSEETIDGLSVLAEDGKIGVGKFIIN